MDGVIDWVTSVQRLIASTSTSSLLRTAPRISAWISWLALRVSVISSPWVSSLGSLPSAFYSTQFARFVKQTTLTASRCSRRPCCDQAWPMALGAPALHPWMFTHGWESDRARGVLLGPPLARQVIED